MSEGQRVNEGAVAPAVTTSAEPGPPRPLASQSRERLTPGQWGIIAFLCSEVSFFSTLIVAYVAFMGRDHMPGGMKGPVPRDVLSLGLVIVTTICLLSSSGTIHLAERALRKHRRYQFMGFWAATILLGAVFLGGTAIEWHALITQHNLTISRNLFGSTFYTLVGFHAIHVTAGVLIMSLVLALSFAGNLNHAGVTLVGWYWHFVDGVWIVVFSVVYLSAQFS